MNILQKIIKQKKPKIEQLKTTIPVSVLEKSDFFVRSCLSMRSALQKQSASGIIAEFKRKSPSKGFINQFAQADEVTKGYAQAGASGVSVLTDTEFFAGNNKDLSAVRKYLNIPVLRKDFIFDEYQIIEAKSIGADVILLIAEVLTKTQIRQFVRLAHSLGLEVLMELHDIDQLPKISDEIDMIGINNRNLKTFEVSIQHSIQMRNQLPNGFVYVSESGIKSPRDVQMLKKHQFQGFLIGESFMKTENPPQACQKFIKSLQ